MKIIDANAVHGALGFPALIDALQATFARGFSQPPRQVHLLDERGEQRDAFALLPSWNGDFIAVKAFTYFPQNSAPHGRLYSKILIFDRTHGEPLAVVDGTSCTYWRTAGVSGLATRLLAREDASTMLLLGTGSLTPYLIRANAAVRPLRNVMVWGNLGGRPSAKGAQAVADRMEAELPEVEFAVVNDLERACAQADIIVCATASEDILVRGAWIRPGTHLDFIGNHHADKRECDTGTITGARVFVDSYVNAFKEAGELLVPIEEGNFRREDVVAELAQMCRATAPLRSGEDEITLFKSIGQAVTDLVAASMAYQA